MLNFLKLKHLEEYSLDDPKRTILHKEVILSKKFLKSLYLEWYDNISKELKQAPKGKIIELGSGGGFFKDVYPDAITSDVLDLPGLDIKFDALKMPFKNSSVAAFVMIDVFHHVPDSEIFLSEMNRCLLPGGKIIMQEPCNSIWSKFIFNNFHHEDFDTSANWKIKGKGPLSSANGALPWIVFERDFEIFKDKFPRLKLQEITKHTPLRYLISGGVSMKQLVPNFTFSFFTLLETLLKPMSNFFSMFQLITISKN